MLGFWADGAHWSSDSILFEPHCAQLRDASAWMCIPRLAADRIIPNQVLRSEDARFRHDPNVWSLRSFFFETLRGYLGRCFSFDGVVLPPLPLTPVCCRLSFAPRQVTYYNRSARARGPGGLRCEHRLLQDHLLMFNSGQLLARFEYKEIMPFNM